MGVAVHMNNNYHNVIMEGRSKVSISGVTDVDCFDENTILIYTIMGELTIKGNCGIMEETKLRKENSHDGSGKDEKEKERAGNNKSGTF